jgi:hypothetical protein
MRNPLPSAVFATVLVLAAAAPSQAAIIDFTDADAWGGANGDNDYTSATFYDGVMVNVKSFPSGSITFNSFGGGFVGGLLSYLCGEATGGDLACDGDGLGIGDDEISFSGTPISDAILVTFFQPFTSILQPVDVTHLGFLNLFGSGPDDPNAEVARWAAIPAVGPLTDGTVTGTEGPISFGLAVQPVNLTGIVAMLFYTGDQFGVDVPNNSDFSLAGINMTPTEAAPVPEPATLLLTGGGLLAAAYRSRRRRV